MACCLQLLEMVKDGNESQRKAWELFNKLRDMKKVNVIHYNVSMLITYCNDSATLD